MKYLTFKDIKNRLLFHKTEKNQIVYKYLFLNLNQQIVSPKLLHVFLALSKKYIRLNSKTRLMRRCVLSNRNRSVFRPYNLSRIFLRNFMGFGIIPGYKKSVW
jgi:ribosomal protein S14